MQVGAAVETAALTLACSLFKTFFLLSMARALLASCWRLEAEWGVDAGQRSETLLALPCIVWEALKRP